jgi:hypothetical protein
VMACALSAAQIYSILWEGISEMFHFSNSLSKLVVSDIATEFNKFLTDVLRSCGRLASVGCSIILDEFGLSFNPLHPRLFLWTLFFLQCFTPDLGNF